jgi:transcription initiation factor TFIIIB Brf1 subunit/transcription initiation factor TFIIB
MNGEQSNNAHTVELDKANKVLDDFHRALTELGYEHAGDMVIDYIRDYAQELGLPEGVQS